MNSKRTQLRLLEKLLISSPLLWLFSATFTLQNGKSILGKLTVFVALYCLIRFRHEWRTNFKNKNFKTFTKINIAVLGYFLVYHLLLGESFRFIKVLIISQLYLVCAPWRLFSLRDISYYITTGAIITGLFSFYEAYYLNLPRVGETASNPIPYASFSLVLLLSSIYFLFILKNNIYQIAFYSTAAIFSLLTVILTQSRGSWIAFLYLVFIIILEAYRKINVQKSKRSILIFIILIAIAGAGIFTNSSKINSRYQQTVNEFNNIKKDNLNTSIGIRLQLWERGFHYFKQEPLFGNGTKLYLEKTEQDKINGLISPIASKSANAHLHNQYMDTLVRNGVTGLSVLLIWIFLPIWLLHRHNLSALRNWAMGTAIMVLIGGLTDVPFHHESIIYLYAMLMGIILLIEPSSHELQQQSSG